MNMKSFFLMLFCCYLSLSGTLLSAHAVVTESSIKVAPVKPEQASEVSVNFNSHIELALSKVYLVRKGDKKESLNISRGRKPGQMLLQIPALPEGEYALHFKVFAADGHLTNDIIHFFVQP